MQEDPQSYTEEILANSEGAMLTQPALGHAYIYALDNPVNLTDPDGRVAWWAVGAAVGGAIGAYRAYQSGARGRAVVSAGLRGAATGAMIGAGVGGAVRFGAAARIGRGVIAAGRAAISSRGKSLLRWGPGQVPGKGNVWRIASGGEGSGLPFHLHVHRYNWTRPWTWASKRR